MRLSTDGRNIVWASGSMEDAENQRCLACGRTMDICNCFVAPAPPSNFNLAVANDILKKMYLPAVREHLNKMLYRDGSILAERFDEKGNDPFIVGLDTPDVVGGAAIDEFRRRRSRSRNHDDY